VQASLDKFFSDDNAWQQVAHEVARTMKLRASMHQLKEPLPGKSLKFRVQVPKPYPGVQYRRTKDLSDKYPSYAKHGSTITGEVEDDREWVRVRRRDVSGAGDRSGGSLYLPLRLGPVQILEPLPEANGKGRGSKGGSREGDGKSPR